MKYEVPILYRGQANYIVEAETPDQAQKKAMKAFNNGDDADWLGNDMKAIEKVCKAEIKDKQ